MHRRDPSSHQLIMSCMLTCAEKPSVTCTDDSDVAPPRLTPEWCKLLRLIVKLGALRSISQFKNKLRMLGLGAKKHPLSTEVELFIARTYHEMRLFSNSS